jgi:hypothetical protein
MATLSNLAFGSFPPLVSWNKLQALLLLHREKKDSKGEVRWGRANPTKRGSFLLILF